MAKRQIKWLKRKIELIKILYHICPICGNENDSNSQFAHVDNTDLNGMGRGIWKRYYDVVNNLDKYRYMHENCHDYYDSVLREN